MDPNQQPYNPQPTPPGDNPYHFITETNHQPKKSLGLKQGSFRSRMLVILGGGLILIILVIVISQLAFGSKASNAKLLKNLVAEQQEIVRVTNLGLRDAKNSDTLTFTQTAQTITTYQQASLLAYLQTKNVKILPAEYLLGKNTATDTALAAAKANNQYDSVFLTTLRNMLVTYANNVKKNYDNASNQTSKTMLANDYNSLTTLLKN